jgi:hypothetical protein
MACLCVDLRNKDIGHRKYFLMNALGTYLSQNLQSRNSLNIYPENVSIKSLLTEAIIWELKYKSFKDVRNQTNCDVRSDHGPMFERKKRRVWDWNKILSLEKKFWMIRCSVGRVAVYIIRHENVALRSLVHLQIADRQNVSIQITDRKT